MFPQSYTSSGYNISIHPTAVRRPDYIKANSDNTTYTDEHIVAKYAYRGADVVVSDSQSHHEVIRVPDHTQSLKDWVCVSTSL